MATVQDACYALAADCRANGTRFRLGPVLQAVRGARGRARRLACGAPPQASTPPGLRPPPGLQSARLQHAAPPPSPTPPPPPQVLADLLPESAAASASGRTFVAVTRLLPAGGGLLAPALVSEFGTKADLIAALMTSCHVRGGGAELGGGGLGV